jgi:hypothetical protein
MARSDPVRQYIVFDAENLLKREVKERLCVSEVKKALDDALGGRLLFAVESLPWAKFIPYEGMDPPPPYIPESVAVLISPNEAEAAKLRRAVEDLIKDPQRPKSIAAISADPAIGGADFSFPGSVEIDLFGTREDAHRLIGLDALPASLGLTGNGVNVVVIDAGLDYSLIPASQHGTGWQPEPGGPGDPPGPLPGDTKGKDALHGMMVVQNILKVAPQARIWDVPLIPPPRINNLGSFVSSAQATFDVMIPIIDSLKGLPSPPRPLQQWVFVNAWGVFDRRSEPVLGNYTENLANPHIFIHRIEQLASRNFDIVFCAGNCGGVCPDGRCGPNDYGPGRGIWGANAHAKVLTVGAVRTDTSWIGYSSEGPGPGTHLAHDKPDLCAPSHYTENGGDFPPNHGTSAAAALAAGVVTAFRSKTLWSQTAVPPASLINALNTTTPEAIKGLPWDRRFGNGILDAAKATTKLP